MARMFVERGFRGLLVADLDLKMAQDTAEVTKKLALEPRVQLYRDAR